MLNLLKRKGDNSCTEKGLYINKLTLLLNEQEFFVVVFSNITVFVSFITAAKINTFTIFLVFDL